VQGEQYQPWGVVKVRIGAKRKSRIPIEIIKLMSNSAEAIVPTNWKMESRSEMKSERNGCNGEGRAERYLVSEFDKEAKTSSFSSLILR